MLLKVHLITHRAAPTTKNNLGPNANSVEVGKLHLREAEY